MAHQAHNIPWSVLTTHLGYRKGSDGHKEIVGLNKSDQVDALLSFARCFAKNLREYASSERRKYHTATEYKRRADTWMKSDRWPDEQIAADRTTDGQSKSRHRTKKQSIIATETRKVFSDHDRDVWGEQSSMFSHGRPTQRQQYIDDWIIGKGHWSHVDWHRRANSEYVYVKEWTQIVKTMLLDSALMLTPMDQRQKLRDEKESPHMRLLDTLFLLAHHRSIPLSAWMHKGDGWSMGSPMMCMAEAALKAYIYFNMLYAMRESGSEVCDLVDDIRVDYGIYHRRHQQIPKRSLRPRPGYMNTTSWAQLLRHVVGSHSQDVQSLAFEPFLFPLRGENFSLVWPQRPFPVSDGRYGPPRNEEIFEQEEADVMSVAPEDKERLLKEPMSTRGSAVALKEFLRGLWRLLVIFDMLCSDMDRELIWHHMAARALDHLFIGVCQDGMIWHSLFVRDSRYTQVNDWDNIFEGPLIDFNTHEPVVKDEDGLFPMPEALRTQKAKNQETRREARRAARAQDKRGPSKRNAKGLIRHYPDCSMK